MWLLLLGFVFLYLFFFYAWKPIVNYFRLLRFAFRIPTASGALPLVGHGYAACKDNSQSSFGFTVEEENISCQEYKDNLQRGEDAFMKRFRQPWLHFDFLYRNSALKSEADKIVGILQKASLKVLKRVKETYAKDDNNKEFRPFLEILFKNSANGAISIEQMRAEIDGIIATGFDTTSIAIVYALILLGANPESQEKVYRELMDIYGDSDRDVAKEDLAQMIYLEAAIKETLRIFPNVPFTGRELDRDMQFKQYRLPAGATVFLSHWGINRHKCWGVDVEEFKPERWLDKATLPSGHFPTNTFGIGRRSCVGKIYAMVTMKAVLAHVLRRYKVTASTEGIRFQFAFSLQPVGEVPINVELR